MPSAKETTKRQELRNECEKYARKYNLAPNNLATGLEYFALHVLCLDPKVQGILPPFEKSEDLDLEEFRTGGSFDGDIDGVLYDEDLQHVFIIQTKFYAGKVDANSLKDPKEITLNE